MSARQWFEVHGRTFFAIADPQYRHTAFFGLVRFIPAERRLDYRIPPAPRGWRHRKAYHRNAVYEMPLWLYGLARVWDWRFLPIQWGLSLGLLDLAECDYYRNARPRCPSWLWCFVNDLDHDPRQSEWAA